MVEGTLCVISTWRARIQVRHVLQFFVNEPRNVTKVPQRERKGDERPSEETLCGFHTQRADPFRGCQHTHVTSTAAQIRHHKCPEVEVKLLAFLTPAVAGGDSSASHHNNAKVETAVCEGL